MALKNVRIRSHNIISHIKGYAKNVKIEIEIWKLFFPDDMLCEIFRIEICYIQKSALNDQSSP